MNVYVFMFEFWALLMLSIVIVNRPIKENIREVVIKTKDKIVPGKDTGVEIVTDEMERDMEEGAKYEYFKSRY